MMIAFVLLLLKEIPFIEPFWLGMTVILFVGFSILYRIEELGDLLFQVVFYCQMAEEQGLRAVPLTDLAAAAAAFDTVVNTIPAPVLTAAVLAALPKGCLIVDLASKPGGTDFAAARRLGHTALHALSLPTVWAPETAGEALARTVQTILQEREETI